MDSLRADRLRHGDSLAPSHWSPDIIDIIDVRPAEYGTIRVRHANGEFTVSADAEVRLARRVRRDG